MTNATSARLKLIDLRTGVLLCTETGRRWARRRVESPGVGVAQYPAPATPWAIANTYS
jgi:hypothetical protein